jgi:hypothetical protein
MAFALVWMTGGEGECRIDREDTGTRRILERRAGGMAGREEEKSKGKRGRGENGKRQGANSTSNQTNQKTR